MINLIVTKEIKGFQEQNSFFQKRVPNRFARVFAMAQDIKKKIDSEYDTAEEQRLEFRRKILEARTILAEQRKKGETVG